MGMYFTALLCFPYLGIYFISRVLVYYVHRYLDYYQGLKFTGFVDLYMGMQFRTWECNYIPGYKILSPGMKLLCLHFIMSWLCNLED
jgi:hypothetical protein